MTAAQQGEDDDSHQRRSMPHQHQQHRRVLKLGRLLLKILILSIGISQIIIAERALRHPTSSFSTSIGRNESSIATLSSNFYSQQSLSAKDGDEKKKKKAQKATDAIVYLAQFSKVHSTYGAQQDIENNTLSGDSKLSKSLDLLYSNYVNNFPNNVHVIIFYVAEEGEPTAEVMEDLQLTNRPQLQLLPLNSTYWSLPYGLQKRDSFFWNRPMYSIGYRHMMRWFAILIWPYLTDLGYTHVMRLDDDSYIHSEIKYNLFDFMRDNNKVYGFRQPVIEDAVGLGWDSMVDSFLHVYKDATTQEQIDDFKKDRRISFYNNFFIADISFFMRPPASIFLNVIDRSNLIYTQRTGDLVIHSTVVRLLVSPDKIHWFRDFSYQHMTLCTNPKCGYGVMNGCPQNGGLSRGVGTYTDEEWNAITLDLQQTIKYDKKVVVLSVDKPVRECLWLLRRMTFIGARDVSNCLMRKERCYPYLKQFLSSNEIAESTKFIPS
jgi:alpha 1,2-mannosyltransferase